MSAETGQIYEFGEFRLDPTAKALRRGNEPVALTPKVFDTLQFMVEHAGRLLEKDELMEHLWQGRFVEESNLTFNIKMLRRALGDDAQSPRFIETVPRRGYRFIAEIKVSSPPPAKSSQLTSAARAPRHKQRALWLLSLAIILLVVSVVAAWLWHGGTQVNAHATPILAARFKVQKLSNTGSLHALITPDGKYVAYTNESGGKQSIWLRQLESSENIQVVPSADVRYLGLAISHDGNSLYFARLDHPEEASSAIYRVMTFGGIPVKVADQAEGWIGVSPDDKQISFVRCANQPNDNCSLFIIDNDGRNERRVLTRAKPMRITANKFSRDGKSMVFAAGQSANGSRDFHLFQTDLASGVEKQISQSTFFVVHHLEVLPADDGLLFSAEETLDGTSRIYAVLANGETRALTNDSADYDDLSLSKAGDRLVATHLSNTFRLNLAAADGAGNPKDLIAARTFAFAPDGRLVYSGDDGDIWIINRDGSGQRQLTSNSFKDFSPRVSPDGRYIFFASNRTGSNQVWRMNADGSDQIQITQREGGYPQVVTPDGKYVFYLSGFHQTIWRVSIEGGEEVEFSPRTVFASAFSPDGKLVACGFRDADKLSKIAIMSIADGQTLRIFPLNGDYKDTLKMVWANDQRSLNYVSGKGDQKALWQQPLDDGAPRLIANLGSDDVEELAVSPDGSSLAFTRGKWLHDAILIEGLK
ncbi:MAG TPA: winged helix-turn-helix domain-containing protein [Pyrinomonadaceae bacterium]|nr:winged helix-turn-helix domain-containing protein [Pyrinomonadaceae bacterium]